MCKFEKLFYYWFLTSWHGGWRRWSMGYSFLDFWRDLRYWHMVDFWEKLCVFLRRMCKRWLLGTGLWMFMCQTWAVLWGFLVRLLFPPLLFWLETIWRVRENKKDKNMTFNIIMKKNPPPIPQNHRSRWFTTGHAWVSCLSGACRSVPKGLGWEVLLQLPFYTSHVQLGSHDLDLG